MFTADDLHRLLSARPFVPFRLFLSDGGTIDVRSQEAVVIGRRWAVIGLLDPKANETFFDRFAIVYYLHVSRAEQMGPGSAPFGPPAGPAGSTTPSPV